VSSGRLDLDLHGGDGALFGHPEACDLGAVLLRHPVEAFIEEESNRVVAISALQDFA
jgi:hypothetical protein